MEMETKREKETHLPRPRNPELIRARTRKHILHPHTSRRLPLRPRAIPAHTNIRRIIAITLPSPSPIRIAHIIHQLDIFLKKTFEGKFLSKQNDSHYTIVFVYIDIGNKVNVYNIDNAISYVMLQL